MATAGAETGPQRSPGAIWTLVVVALATFMLMLDLTVVNVALPDIRAAFGSSFSALQWILDAYALGLAAVLLAAGSLADRLGRKRVFDVGLVVFVLSSLACGLASSDDMLIVARFVQGLGGAILFAVGPALLGHEFRGKDRGMAFGVFGAVTGLAIAFGPLIGGGLAESAGWRWIFLINVPVTIAAIAIGYFKMRESRSETPPPVDWPGMVAFSAGLFFLVLGFMRGEQDGWTSWTVLGCFTLAVALLAGFTWLQITRPERAMFDLSLFGNRTFNGLSVVTALCALTVMPALFLLIAYVQNMLGHSAYATGVRFLPLTLLLFVAAAGAGALVTKVHPGVLVGISQLLIAAGLAAVVLVDTESAWTALIPAMILIGLGMGVFNPPRAAFSIAVTTPDKSGMASGINETFQQAGVAVGIAAIGALFHNQVSGAFAETDTARRVFDEQATTAGDAVAAGGPSVVLDGLPAAATEMVRSAAETAFVDGLHTTMLVVAALAAISGVIALFTMRPRDLDEAALDSPGVPAGDTGDPALGSARPTDRPSELAAQRAAQIIAQAKADAQETDNSGHATVATLTKAPAATAKATKRSNGTSRSPQSRAGSATGRQAASVTPGSSEDATIRTAPVGRRADTATRRGSSATRRSAATDRGRTALDVTTPDTAELETTKDAAPRGDTVPRSPVSGRFTDAGTRRTGRTGDAAGSDDRAGRDTTRTATSALSDAERREAAGKHRLTDPKAIASAAQAARRAPSASSDPSPSPAGPAARPAAPSTSPAASSAPTAPTREESNPADKSAATASPAETGSAAAGSRRSESATAGAPTTGSASGAQSATAGRRAAARARANIDTGGKHRAAGSETTTAATPRHASRRRAGTSSAPSSSTAVKGASSPTASTSAATASEARASGATTSNSTSSPAAADAEVDSAASESRGTKPRSAAATGGAPTDAKTTDAKATDAKATDTAPASAEQAGPAPASTEQPSTAPAAAKRPTARKRTRGAAKAPADQASAPTRAAEQPAKAAGQPAKATKQPAKRTASGSPRNTAAKKTAAATEKGTTPAKSTASRAKSTASGTTSRASGAKGTVPDSKGTVPDSNSTAD